MHQFASSFAGVHDTNENANGASSVDKSEISSSLSDPKNAVALGDEPEVVVPVECESDLMVPFEDPPKDACEGENRGPSDVSINRDGFPVQPKLK